MGLVFMKWHNLVLRAKTSIAQELPKILKLKLVNLGDMTSMYKKMGIFQLETWMRFQYIVPSKTVDVKGRRNLLKPGQQSLKNAELSNPCVYSCWKYVTTYDKYSRGQLLRYQRVKWYGHDIKKGWMDEKLMLTWIKGIWVKHTKKRPSLLVPTSQIRDGYPSSRRLHIHPATKNQQAH